MHDLFPLSQVRDRSSGKLPEQQKLRSCLLLEAQTLVSLHKSVGSFTKAGCTCVLHHSQVAKVVSLTYFQTRTSHSVGAEARMDSLGMGTLKSERTLRRYMHS